MRGLPSLKKSSYPALLAGALIFPLLVVTASFGAADASDLSADKLHEIGERMYREGVLPSGKPMQAYVSDDVPVDGTAFTCVSCHLRSGLGSIEGEVVTPPTNGRILYQPRHPYIQGFEKVPSFSNYAKYLPVRPAYTEASLADLIANGVDPTGRSVLDAMPRYDLNDREMAILIAYLNALSDQPPPGVTQAEIRFATVIVEGTDPVAVESMLTPIQFGIDRKNSLAAASENNARVARMAYNMLGPDLLRKRFTLARWILKGPPATWRAQLDAYYRAEPVFALLGGISEGEWEPVHRFCEEMRIPNLFPVVDYPVLSDSDWYTLYLSRGVRQEGEAAARYLRNMQQLFAGRPIVQIVRGDRRGESLAAGFRAIWDRTGQPPAVDLILPSGQALTAERLGKIIDEYQPAALIVWDDHSFLEALEGIAPPAQGPGIVIASGTYLGEALWTIPEPLRDRLFLTYPYRLPQEEARFDISVRRALGGKPIDAFDPRVVRQSTITNDLLGMVLMEMRGEYYRDFLLDTIGMLMDMYFPLYERLSFGPGQRYASKGCYIVQLGKGPAARLERRSEWVIQ